MSSALSGAPLLLQETGVSPTRTRGQFTTTYTLQILAAADACTKLGELGALLRREGLYSSHLALWLVVSAATPPSTPHHRPSCLSFDRPR